MALKLIWSTDANISNAPFKLHYKLTSLILLCFCLSVALYRVFTATIQCTGSDNFLPFGYIQSYCLLPSQEREGIDLGFYPYVWPFLLFQAACFGLPNALWKLIEGGKIKQFARVLNKADPAIDEGVREVTLKRLAAYAVDNLGLHTGYAVGFFLCELLNFINAVVQIFITDRFLGGAFMVGGNQSSGTAFPNFVTCEYLSRGASGAFVRRDIECVLPLNGLHSELFNFLWFWFVFVALISGLVLVYRIAWMIIPKLRYCLLRKYYIRAGRQQLLDALANQFHIGDWFVMDLILQNTHAINLQSFLSYINDPEKHSPLHEI